MQQHLERLRRSKKEGGKEGRKAKVHVELKAAG